MNRKDFIEKINKILEKAEGRELDLIYVFANGITTPKVKKNENKNRI